MRRPYVKLCGVTRVEDAVAAAAAGVDAVGLVLVPGSPRRLAPEAAAAIAAHLPLGIARVGVTADLDPEEARAAVRTIGLTAIQAHGSETPEVCRAYGLPVVKAFPAGNGFDPAALEPYREFPVLLDGSVRSADGGTGRTADWSAARRAVENGFRVLLAGGLSPENLREAVEAVRPRAVDLNSGVESAPGVKDPGRVRRALGLLTDLDPPEEDAWPW